MADTAATLAGEWRLGGLCGEVHTGTTGAASTDALVVLSRLSKIVFAKADWQEDIGTTAVSLDCTVSGSTVSVMTNGNLAKSAAVLLLGYP